MFITTVLSNTVTIQPNEIVIQYGQAVTFRCDVSGGAGPFTFNDWEVPEISASLIRGNVTITNYTSTLTFIVFEEDSGEYGCQIEENSGSPALATLTVGKSC